MKLDQWWSVPLKGHFTQITKCTFPYIACSQSDCFVFKEKSNASVMKTCCCLVQSTQCCYNLSGAPSQISITYSNQYILHTCHHSTVVVCLIEMWVNWPFKFLFTSLFLYCKGSNAILTSSSTKLNKCVLRLRQVKMEKRILADQGNTLVDLCKVREASERIISTLPPIETSTK